MLRPRWFRWIGPLLISLSGFALVASCGSSSGPSGFGSSGSGSGSGSGGGSSSGGGSNSSGGSGGSTGSSSGGGMFGTGDGGTGPISADAACAAMASKGQQAPLDIYIMLDQSASMSDMVAGGMTKWQAVTSALNTFVMTPQQGVSVGL